jgi:hypothetical protein
VPRSTTLTPGRMLGAKETFTPRSCRACGGSAPRLFRAQSKPSMLMLPASRCRYVDPASRKRAVEQVAGADEARPTEATENPRAPGDPGLSLLGASG